MIADKFAGPGERIAGKDEEWPSHRAVTRRACPAWQRVRVHVCFCIIFICNIVCVCARARVRVCAVLANVMRKPMEEMLYEFMEGTIAADEEGHLQGSGDVKYHLGFTMDRPTHSGKLSGKHR